MKSACSASIVFAAVLFSNTLAYAAMPAGDPAKGATLFASNCAACHSAVKGGGDEQGPNLYSVYNRKAGSEAGFAYSDGFAKTTFVWDDSHLDAWLTKPTAVIPGSYMMYAQPSPQIRADIIAYLKSLDSK